MTEEHKKPFYIGVEATEEHEDGSATYTLTMDSAAEREVKDLGLSLSCTVVQQR